MSQVRLLPGARKTEYGGQSSIGRAPDCGSGGCGFNPRCSPQDFRLAALARRDRAWSAGRWRAMMAAIMVRLLRLRQPPTRKRVFELLVDGPVGRWFRRQGWAGFTLPLPRVFLIFYWNTP